MIYLLVFIVILFLYLIGLASVTQARLNTEPEFVIFASYSPPPKTPLKISTLREMVCYVGPIEVVCIFAINIHHHADF